MLELATFIGIMITLLGLGVAIVQLNRTKKSAKAAAESAKETARRISSTLNVVSLEQISSRSRDLQHLVRAKNLRAAATAAFELREAMARMNIEQMDGIQNPVQEKKEIMGKIVSVYERLEAAAQINKSDAEIRVECLNDIAKIHDWISAMTGEAAAIAGGIYGKDS